MLRNVNQIVTESLPTIWMKYALIDYCLTLLMLIVVLAIPGVVAGLDLRAINFVMTPSAEVD